MKFIEQSSRSEEMVFPSISTTLLIFSFFLLPNYMLRGVTGKCHVDDEAGLLGFKSGITKDPMGMLKKWIPGTDCCEWWGVECRFDRNNRVTAVHMSLPKDNPKYYMSGTLSSSLTKIRHLDTLSLYYLRNITGTFPKFLYRLPKMIYLVIDHAKLLGSIPLDISRGLPNLRVLSIPGNRFTGMIPRSISQLTHLIDLQLHENFLVGKIPNGIRELKNLTNLSLARNRLSGPIPDVFTSVSNLWSLDLSHNKLSGNIPPTTSALAHRLAFLELGHNALTGKIPNYLGMFTHLDTLDLSSNRLSGAIPQSFKNLTKMFNLDLSRNHLVNPFPQMNVKGIESLDLSYNKLKLGKIPTWVTSSPIIYSLKLAGCGIKMRLQDWKPVEAYYYDYIDLSNNQIYGSPVELLNRTDHIIGFSASRNQLKFNMSELKLPKTLKYLDLSHNQISGNVP